MVHVLHTKYSARVWLFVEWSSTSISLGGNFAIINYYYLPLINGQLGLTEELFKTFFLVTCYQ